MARTKEGLDYFPLDTGMDDNFEYIETKYGLAGFAVLIKLYQAVYKDKGYYYLWTEKEQVLFSGRVKLSINELNEIIEDAVKCGIFDREKYEMGILTSHGIQKRYLEACKRRASISLYGSILLVSDEEIEDMLPSCKHCVNIMSTECIHDVNFSTQRKGKEKKRKESTQHDVACTSCDTKQTETEKDEALETSDALFTDHEGDGSEEAGKESTVPPDDQPKNRPKRKRDPRKTYGLEGLVSLTEKEYSTLLERYGPEQTEKLIDRLDSYKQTHGKTYKSDAGAIRQWVIDAVGVKPIKPPQQELAPVPIKPKPLVYFLHAIKCPDCGIVILPKEIRCHGCNKPCNEFDEEFIRAEKAKDVK